MSQDEIQLPEPEELDGGTDPGGKGYGIAYGYTATTVRRLIAEAVAAEREACAEVCKTQASIQDSQGRQIVAECCAASIRARGAKT